MKERPALPALPASPSLSASLRPVVGPNADGCPVCNARFRGRSQCSRCGADLSALMLIAAHAWLLRKTARQSLKQGDYRAALDSIRAAQQLQSTEEGGLLEFVCLAASNVEIQGKVIPGHQSSWR